MTAARKIEEKVNSIGSGVVFSIGDLGLPKEWWDNIRVKLSRMVEKGKIKKISKGRFYKPRKSLFGDLSPDLNELAKDLVKDEKGKPIGYLTSYSVWNSMSLTTQVSNVLVIGTNKRTNPKKRGVYSIRFLLQPNKITKENIFLLQILDAIKFIRKIPDSSISSSILGLKSLIGKLDDKEIPILIKLAAKYPPRVKALLGAMLEDMGYGSLVSALRESLNPGTYYDLRLKNNTLPNKTNWNIR